MTARINLSAMIALAVILWIIVGMFSTPMTLMFVIAFAKSTGPIQTLMLGFFPVLVTFGGIAALVAIARKLDPLWPITFLAAPLVCPFLDSAVSGGNLVQLLTEYGSHLKFWQWWA